jgi:ribosomal protein L9
MVKQIKETKEKAIEVTLWEAANKLRGSVEPAEYKHVVLGLIFLKFASDKFEERRAELEKQAAEKLAAANARGEAISKLNVTIAHKTGDEGRLFGSVGTQNIAEAVTAAGVKVEKHEVRMPNGVIRQVGEYDIAINLHTDVVVTLPIKIVAE